MMRRLWIVLLVAASGMALAVGAVAAAEDSEALLDGKVRAGESLTVAADEEVEDDLYLFGTSVTVEADVPGDVIVFASDVTLAGDIGGDVLAGSSVIRVLGDVDGDVRAGAGTIEVRGTVAEDVAAAAGVLTMSGEIGGDVLFGAGQATFSGTVDGDVEGSAGAYSSEGTIRGVENVRIEQPDVGRAERSVWLRGLSRLVALVLVGAAVVTWLRRSSRAAVERVTEQPASALLWGAVAWIGLVVAAIAGIVVAIILGIVFGLLRLDVLVGLGVFSGLMITVTSLLLLFIGTVFVGPVISATALGEAMLQRQDEPPLLALAAGTVVIVGLWLIPFVGPVVMGLAVAFGLGALFLVWRRRRESPSTQEGNAPALP